MTRNVTRAMARSVGISHSTRETAYWTNQAPPVASAPLEDAGECAYYLASGGGSQGVKDPRLTLALAPPQTQFNGP